MIFSKEVFHHHNAYLDHRQAIGRVSVRVPRIHLLETNHPIVNHQCQCPHLHRKLVLQSKLLSLLPGGVR